VWRRAVLLHGQPGSAADWQQLARRLPAALRAVAIDRSGHVASPLLPAGFAANARAVLDELDSRGIQRAVLVGHSYGGGVALMASQGIVMYPSRSGSAKPRARDEAVTAGPETSVTSSRGNA
jgi:esterase/lipase